MQFSPCLGFSGFRLCQSLYITCAVYSVLWKLETTIKGFIIKIIRTMYKETLCGVQIFEHTKCSVCSSLRFYLLFARIIEQQFCAYGMNYSTHVLAAIL